MSADSSPRLQVRGVCFEIGGNSIVRELDLEVSRGSVLGLIGPNGAGKTTAIDLICGFSQPSKGSVLLDGVDITRQRPDHRVRLGLARTFQESPTIPDLRVREHVQLAIESCGRTPLHSGADEWLARVGLEESANALADDLLIGDRRMLDLSRAIATQPSVLLLDEPFAGLTSEQQERLSGIIASLTAEGVAVVIIEHRLRLLNRVADTSAALVQGTCVATGSLESVLARPEVRDAYLARHHGAGVSGKEGPLDE